VNHGYTFSFRFMAPEGTTYDDALAFMLREAGEQFRAHFGPRALSAPDLAATVEALEAERDEARLCLLAEAGDPRGAEGLHPGWVHRPGGWCLSDDGSASNMRAMVWRARPCDLDELAPLHWQRDFAWGERGKPVPAGLTIREAMRWVEREVGL